MIRFLLLLDPLDADRAGVARGFSLVLAAHAFQWTEPVRQLGTAKERDLALLRAGSPAQSGTLRHCRISPPRPPGWRASRRSRILLEILGLGVGRLHRGLLLRCHAFEPTCAAGPACMTHCPLNTRSIAVLCHSDLVFSRTVILISIGHGRTGRCRLGRQRHAQDGQRRREITPHRAPSVDLPSIT